MIVSWEAVIQALQGESREERSNKGLCSGRGDLRHLKKGREISQRVWIGVGRGSTGFVVREHGKGENMGAIRLNSLSMCVIGGLRGRPKRLTEPWCSS